MQDIKCPHCGKAFSFDEAEFADIHKQVRDHQLEDDKAHQTIANAALEAARDASLE